MFNSKKESSSKKEYEVNVLAARQTKNDSIVMVDLEVNGVKIYSCIFKEVTVKKDGEKYKKGDKCYMLNLPQEKSGDKYYNRAWFPVSNENIEDICKQVESLL